MTVVSWRAGNCMTCPGCGQSGRGQVPIYDDPPGYGFAYDCGAQVIYPDQAPPLEASYWQLVDACPVGKEPPAPVGVRSRVSPLAS